VTAGGGFVEATASPFDFGDHAFHAIVADLNRDGKMDVIAAGGDSVRVMLGGGRGGFARGPTTLTGRGTWRLDRADLNGDGKTDVVTANSESGTISVLLGRQSNPQISQIAQIEPRATALRY